MTGWMFREVSDIDKEVEEERSRVFFGTVVRDEEPYNLETIYRAEASMRACKRTFFLKNPRPALRGDARPGHRPTLQPLRQRQAAAVKRD